jgi:hypothetical protein
MNIDGLLRATALPWTSTVNPDKEYVDAQNTHSGRGRRNAGRARVEHVSATIFLRKMGRVIARVDAYTRGIPHGHFSTHTIPPVRKIATEP